MAKKPELTKISDTIYGCSVCKDWTVTMVKPHKITGAQWQRRLDHHFADHLKQRHSGEDFSQAAVRIVREATTERQRD